MAMTYEEQVSRRRLSFTGLNKGFGTSSAMSLRAFCWLVILLLLMPLVILRAQELAATLSGTVTDPSGALVPNATITITENGVNGAARVVQTDANGRYLAPNLPAGTYTVKVTATGFETYIGNNVVLNVAEKHALNIALKTGSVSTTITVETNPVSVETETSAQAGTIDGVQIRQLELAGRNFQQLVTLQPGVVSQMGDETSAGNTAMSVNGARTDANNWTIDGADINDSGSTARSSTRLTWTPFRNSPCSAAITTLAMDALEAARFWLPPKPAPARFTATPTSSCATPPWMRTSGSTSAPRRKRRPQPERRESP